MSDRVVEIVLRMKDMATRQMGKVSSAMAGMTAGMKAGIALLAAYVVAKVVEMTARALAAIASFIGGLVELGSAAEETRNVTGLAFGHLAKDAEEWADRYAKATGSSRFETIQLVSDMGLLLTGMGLTRDASLQLSTQMVQLAGDMSSAKNVPLAEALEKIRAGLVGESEPLRSMGVLLSAARVEQEAYASGIAKTGEELTELQKVQARANIIMNDSVAMHGDLVNTQKSVANQMRNLTNTFTDAKTVIGVSLQPAMEAILAIGNELADDLLEWAKGVAVWISAWLKTGGLKAITRGVESFVSFLKIAISAGTSFFNMITWGSRTINTLAEKFGFLDSRFSGAVENMMIETGELIRTTEDYHEELGIMTDDAILAEAALRRQARAAEEAEAALKRLKFRDDYTTRRIEAERDAQEKLTLDRRAYDVRRIQAERDAQEQLSITRRDYNVRRIQAERDTQEALTLSRREYEARRIIAERDAVDQDRLDRESAAVERTQAAWDLAIAGIANAAGNTTATAVAQIRAMVIAVDEANEKMFTKAQIGIAAIGLGLQVVGQEMQDFGHRVLGEVLSDVGSIAVAFAIGGPLLAGIQAAIVGIKWLARGLNELFGVSKAEKERRQFYEDFRQEAVSALSDNMRYLNEVDRQVKQGQDRRIAETKAAFYVYAELAGYSWEVGAALHERYLNAVKSGNKVLMKSIEDQVAGWRRIAEQKERITDLMNQLADLNKQIALTEIDIRIEAVEAERDAVLASFDEQIEAIETRRDVALAAIDAQIKAVEEQRKIALAAIDAQIKAVEEQRDAALDAYDAQIEATEAARDAALEAIDLEIDGIKRLRDERLAAYDEQIRLAEGRVVDTAGTRDAARRLGVDLTDAAGFQRQKASEDILKLAEDITILQKAGIDTRAGLSDEFDEKVRTAVEAASRFGISIPESLRSTLASFSDINMGILRFGDGLTEQVRELNRLKELRKETEEDFNEQIEVLEGERKAAEDKFNLLLDGPGGLREQRDAAEEAFNLLIDGPGGLREKREAAEDKFNEMLDGPEGLRAKREAAEDKFEQMLDGPEGVRTKRKAAEDKFNLMLDGPGGLREQREAIEGTLHDRLETLKGDRDRVEGQLHDAVEAAELRVQNWFNNLPENQDNDPIGGGGGGESPEDTEQGGGGRRGAKAPTTAEILKAVEAGARAGTQAGSAKTVAIPGDVLMRYVRQNLPDENAFAGVGAPR